MTERELREWGDSRRMPDPSPAEAHRLVETAISRRRWRWARWLLLPAVPGGMALVATAALLLVWWGWPSSPVAGGDRPEVVIVGPATQVLAGGTHLVGADVVEVDGEIAATRESHRTVLALRQGTVTVLAAKREAGDGLEVRADDWTVAVVGTRFTVVRAPFSVRVSEGIVAVQRGDERWTLQAGDRFEDGRVLRPPPALPTVAELRRLVLARDFAGARDGLRRRLDVDPEDIDAWKLLAQLETADAQRDPAVVAWREVIARGSPSEAHLARFQAAVALEDRPAEAIPLLEAFLATPDPLAAEAGLRLGRARIALGDRAGAREALQRVVREHPGTGPADLAQGLLRAL